MGREGARRKDDLAYPVSRRNCPLQGRAIQNMHTGVNEYDMTEGTQQGLKSLFRAPLNIALDEAFSIRSLDDPLVRAENSSREDTPIVLHTLSD